MNKYGSELFIDQLQKKGELRIVNQAVDPMLEITEIVDRISGENEGGKAILFKNTGTSFPLLINAFGSDNRIKTIFNNRDPEEISSDILKLFKSLTTAPTSMLGKLSKIPQLGKISSWMPVKRNGRGICQEIVMKSPNLTKLPVLTCWPSDGGPFITLPLVHTTDPESGIRNVGMYRMQVFGETLTGMHWHMHKTGARHFREYKKRGLKMPVAVALGGDPVYTYCATAPLPDGIDEYILAGFIRKKPVELVRCLTQDIWVPGDADFILEGYIDPSEELILEGPFGDHTGFYSLSDYYPRFHITTITHRKKAVFPATIVGIPPQEDAWMAKATEGIFAEPLRLTMIPELTAFHLPEAGVAHNIGLFSIDNNYPGQGKKILNAVWGAGQMMFTKFGIVLNRVNNLMNYSELAKVITKRVNPLIDLIWVQGPLDVLDHSSDEFAIGGKLGIDATNEEMTWQFPIVEDVNEGLRMLISSNPSIRYFNAELLDQGISVVLININKNEKGVVKYLAEEIANSTVLNKVSFWIFTDADLPQITYYELAWIVGSHTDPIRDCFVLSASDDGERGILFIDASRKNKKLDGFKREWPNPVVMDKKTIKKVDKRWDKYDLGKFIRSPSERYMQMMIGEGAIADE